MSAPLLITGVAGFVGRALAARAAAEGARCLGVGRQPRALPDYVALDLSEGVAPILAVLREHRPEVVFHLAGGLGGGQDVFASNTFATRNLLKAVEQLPGYAPRILMMGSAAEYGDLGPEPIREDARECPVGEYGVAKLAQTKLALIARRRGLRVGVVRAFNILGPGMPAELAPARFAREALLAQAEGRGHMTTGDLTPVRDYLDIDDVVEALWALRLRDVDEGVVNLASGQPVQVGALLAEILRQVGVTLELRTSASLVRGPGDVPVSVGSNERLTRLLGRRFSFDLERSVSRLVASLRPGATP